MFWWHAIVVLLIVIITTIFSVIIRRKTDNKEKVTKYDYFIAIIGDMVGGLAVGGYIGFQLGTKIEHIFIAIALYYIIMFWLAFIGSNTEKKSLYGYEEKEGAKKFIVVHMSCHYAFILLWTFLAFSFYSNNYERISNNIVLSSERREIVDIYDLPLQEVSGYIEGNGRSTITGSVSTSAELLYRYKNTETGKTEYDSAPADNSKIDFIDDDETPYLIIKNYTKRDIIVDKSGNEKDVTQEFVNWTEYIFYLPKSMQKKF